MTGVLDERLGVAREGSFRANRDGTEGRETSLQARTCFRPEIMGA